MRSMMKNGVDSTHTSLSLCSHPCCMCSPLSLSTPLPLPPSSLSSAENCTSWYILPTVIDAIVVRLSSLIGSPQSMFVCVFELFDLCVCVT